MSDNLGILFGSLQKEYDLVMDRRKTLNGQAVNIITFSGIINTVLVGILVALATNLTIRATFESSPNSGATTTLLSLGFLAYIIATLMAILGSIEWKWSLAPVVLEGNNPKDWEGQLDGYHKNPTSLPVQVFELQLQNAIHYLTRINKVKYWILFVSEVFLAIGVMATAAAGYLILVSSL